MPRINLLPWREEERRTRQREFGVAAGGAVIGGVAVTMLTMLVFSSMINAQDLRNERLDNEIDLLQEDIEAIDDLERRKEKLLARMDIIDRLQKSRPEVVHLFDEMVRQLPEGVYLTGMKQTGSRIEIRGIAQSSTRVSALMRQIVASEWLADPEVERVETTDIGSSRQADFVVYLKQARPGDDMEEL